MRFKNRNQKLKERGQRWVRKFAWLPIDLDDTEDHSIVWLSHYEEKRRRGYATYYRAVGSTYEILGDRPSFGGLGPPTPPENRSTADKCGRHPSFPSNQKQ